MTVSAVGNKLLYDLLDSTSHSVNDPPVSFATIRNEIEKPEPSERASLIDLLWDSLDDDSVQEIEARWAAESEDRIDAFERGELAAVDGPAALEERRDLLKPIQSKALRSPLFHELAMFLIHNLGVARTIVGTWQTVAASRFIDYV